MNSTTRQIFKVAVITKEPEKPEKKTFLKRVNLKTHKNTNAPTFRGSTVHFQREGGGKPDLSRDCTPAPSTRLREETVTGRGMERDSCVRGQNSTVNHQTFS